jgi:hypothetical protein
MDMDKAKADTRTLATNIIRLFNRLYNKSSGVIDDMQAEFDFSTFFIDFASQEMNRPYVDALCNHILNRTKIILDQDKAYFQSLIDSIWQKISRKRKRVHSYDQTALYKTWSPSDIE